MIKGSFIDGDKPMVEASLAWGQISQDSLFILDTGFTGDLVITKKMAKELNLDIAGQSSAIIANDQIIDVPVANLIANMEGVQLYVTAFITDGWPLLGISFLQKFGYKAVVDCKKKTVTLEISE